MENKQTTQTKDQCKVHVMPPAISDEDISILLNGVVGIIKHKTELETQASIINLNVNIEKLEKQLKQKTAECNRLKNELLTLKAQINLQ